MLNVKTWNPVTFRSRGTGEELFTFEVKRLRYHEAEPIAIVLTRAFAALDRAMRAHGIQVPGDTEVPAEAPNTAAQIDSEIEALREVYGSLDLSVVETVFRDYVREVGGLVVDDEPATTGEALFGVADEGLIFFVLTCIKRFASLTSAMGKGSPSSSQPTSTTETAGSSSAATSTESVDSPRLSDATPALETNPELVSSTGGA